MDILIENQKSRRFPGRRLFWILKQYLYYQNKKEQTPGFEQEIIGSMDILWAILLKNTNRSITHIALSCGFNHLSYYSRLFLRTFGCTPGEYRKRETSFLIALFEIEISECRDVNSFGGHDFSGNQILVISVIFIDPCGFIILAEVEDTDDFFSFVVSSDG